MILLNEFMECSHSIFHVQVNLPRQSKLPILTWLSCSLLMNAIGETSEQIHDIYLFSLSVVSAPSEYYHWIFLNHYSWQFPVYIHAESCT